MADEYKCNGYNGDGCDRLKRLKPNVIKMMDKIIDERRKVYREFKKEEFSRWGGLHAGHRFGDNEAVLLRILSQTTVENMLEFPVQWADGGLACCAQADHWYAFEKDWG